MSVRSIESNDILTAEICWANQKLQVLNVAMLHFIEPRDRRKTKKKFFALNDQKCYETCKKHVFIVLKKKSTKMGINREVNREP